MDYNISNSICNIINWFRNIIYGIKKAQCFLIVLFCYKV